MRRFLLIFLMLVVSGGAIFLLTKENRFELSGPENKVAEEPTGLPSVPEAEPTPAEAVKTMPANKPQDLPPQAPLLNPPATVKAVYVTSWSAGTTSRVDYIIDLIDKTEVNAVVIDIKDYSGYVAYDTGVADADKYGAEEIRIPRVNSLIKKLHDKNIYVIARVTVFQDPILAKARPDLAVKNSITGATWTDRKGLSWIDPASQEAWDYNIAIAKDAAGRGFDEINFDYIRFPSDGDLSIMQYPLYDETKLKQDVIKDFFAYLRAGLTGIRISADLFGLSTINHDDLGIGQVIESAYTYFDFVCPMVYPSHYATGFLGYKNPAEYPYEVVKYSMDNAFTRLTASGITTSKLRPWLQDFDLGAEYNAIMVKKEIQAVLDAFCSPPSSEAAADAQICNPSSNDFGDKFGGWMLWDPNNIYTREALAVEQL